MIYDFEMENIKENSPYWYICENIKSKQKVLDVGCATGYLGSYLKNNFDVDIIGIDYQDYHLKKAKKLNIYSNLIKLDLNSFNNELDQYTSFFDRIILADVLEHLNDPMEVLRKLSKLLKNDGKFLIDIPNIAHSTIKYNLLMNNFNYTSMGLLDKTHVHFFTLNSIIDDLSQNQFFIEDMEYIFLGSEQTCDQNVNYEKYPTEIIDFIENDTESYIYQIFVVFNKSNLNIDALYKHNMHFKKIIDDKLNIKEKFDTKMNNNLIETLEKKIKEKDESIIQLILSNKSKSKTIQKINSSRSWKITKPLRSFTFSLKKLKNSSLHKKQMKISKNHPTYNFSADLGTDLAKILYLESSNYSSYVKKSDRYFEREEGDIKLIAFYLPQFHNTKENDKWWGNGFTEWNNVTRAIPQIKGQYQPQLPDELGFYDLSHNDIFYKQIELAKKYGVYGFCFHYYWFSGKKLLEKPIYNYLNDKNLDFPFMLCWANEPWTRAWDGTEKEVLMPQSFQKEDYIKFIEDIMPFFNDERYIKINNCPILIIYRPQYFPKEAMDAAIEVWRDYVTLNGFNDLYLINAESHDFDSNNKYKNFDASVQFFSHKMSKNLHRDRNAVILNPEFKGGVYDLENFVKEKTYLEDFNYILYRTVLPSWDNTARTMSNATIFNNSSPELYKEWLGNIIEYTKKNYPQKNQFAFLHSWNEWAEGAHLEPDKKYGFAYLEATLKALEEARDDINK